MALSLQVHRSGQVLIELKQGGLLAQLVEKQR